MRTELVRVTTDDGCLLDGVLQRPEAPTESGLPVDAFLLVHGTGSNFYTHGVLETFAHQAVAAGVPALRINTRGHDQVTAIPGVKGSQRGGATYENIADCRLDLAAWIALLAGRGYRRIVLAGHSMGGVKAAFTLAHEQHPEVAALLIISSPRFVHAKFHAHPRAEAFRADYARARQLVAEGQPDQLMRITQPLPLLITAAGFLEKYGPEDRYDLLRFLPRSQRPTLVILGSRSAEQSIAFDGLAEEIKTLTHQHPHLSLRMVEGANINYTGCYEAPFREAREWFQGEAWKSGGPAAADHARPLR